jgi:hypothetical protein
VEFALVLPALLLILFSILEYGWYMTNQLVLVNTVAAGASAGIKARESEGETPVQLAVSAVGAAFWPDDVPEDKIEVDDQYYVGGSGPRMIEVKVTDLQYKSLTGYLPESLLPKTLSARAVMVFP